MLMQIKRIRKLYANQFVIMRIERILLKKLHMLNLVRLRFDNDSIPQKHWSQSLLSMCGSDSFDWNIFDSFPLICLINVIRLIEFDLCLVGFDLG